MTRNSRIEPGFCIVQTPGTLAEQAHMLFGNRHSAAANYFMQINADSQWVKPGQILIVADPDGNNNVVAMQALRHAKNKTNNSITTLSTGEATFLNQHYATIAALTNFMDKSFGFIGDAGEKYYSEIGKKLVAIESAYRNQFITSGSLISEQFFVERRRLFAELDVLLNKLAKITIRLKPYNSIKQALGLSSRSIVHDWSTAGVGVIKGYSTYIDSAARMAKFMKGGGWVSIGFGFLNSTNDVYNACTTGRERECVKVAVKGYANFAASTALSIYGGQLGATIASGVCVAFGVSTGGMGMLACGVVGALAGGYIGSEAGSTASGAIMDMIL